jgi:hypothetical protein
MYLDSELHDSCDFGTLQKRTPIIIFGGKIYNVAEKVVFAGPKFLHIWKIKNNELNTKIKV